MLVTCVSRIVTVQRPHVLLITICGVFKALNVNQYDECVTMDLILIANSELMSLGDTSVIMIGLTITNKNVGIVLGTRIYNNILRNEDIQIVGSVFYSTVLYIYTVLCVFDFVHFTSLNVQSLAHNVSYTLCASKCYRHTHT